MPFIGCCDHATACKVALDQLGASACGATAIYTALLMLHALDEGEVHVLDWSLATVRTRANDAHLAQYLRSRHDAGCTGAELVQSMRAVLGNAHAGLVDCQEFVPFNSLAEGVDVISYLADLFSSGCVVIATFNLQLLGNDAWHHQVVYGVDTAERLLHCTNPIGSYPEAIAVQMLSTPSVLLVRREDVLRRERPPGGDEGIYDEPLWQPFNVPKQMQDMAAAPSKRFLVIPAAYRGGFAIFRRTPS